LRERAIIGAFGLAVVLFATIGAVAFVHLGRFGEQAHWVHHTQQVLTRLEQTLGTMRDIQTGQRGYLIAGDERFLDPYESGLDAVRERLDDLAALTADNPAQQERLAALRPIVEQKIAFVTETVELFRTGEREPPELLHLIFDPFRRAAERKRMKSVGLGLGLYLALQVVRAHEGTIDVESSAEGGTLFRVRLPRHG
jgi:hypothetical protein